LLDRYRPQLAITMMGVNDSSWFGVYAEGALSPSPWRRWIASLVLPKLVEYVYRERWRRPDPGRLDQDMREISAADAQGVRKPRSREVYRRILASGDGSSASSAAGFRLAEQASPADAAAIYATLADIEGAEDGVAGLRAGTAFRAADRTGPRPRLPERGPSAVTEENYRRMGELLRSRGVRFFAMQYPTLPVAKLRELTDFPGATVLIGNEDNFKEALKRRRYDDLFADRFGGGWGHCTAEGDRLIAESAFRGLEKAGVLK